MKRVVRSEEGLVVRARWLTCDCRPGCRTSWIVAAPLDLDLWCPMAMGDEVSTRDAADDELGSVEIGDALCAWLLAYAVPWRRMLTDDVLHGMWVAICSSPPQLAQECVNAQGIDGMRTLRELVKMGEHPDDAAAVTRRLVASMGRYRRSVQ